MHMYEHLLPTDRLKEIYNEISEPYNRLRDYIKKVEIKLDLVPDLQFSAQMFMYKFFYIFRIFSYWFNSTIWQLKCQDLDLRNKKIDASQFVESGTFKRIKIYFYTKKVNLIIDEVSELLGLNRVHIHLDDDYIYPVITNFSNFTLLYQLVYDDVLADQFIKRISKSRNILEKDTAIDFYRKWIALGRKFIDFIESELILESDEFIDFVNSRFNEFISKYLPDTGIKITQKILDEPPAFISEKDRTWAFATDINGNTLCHYLHLPEMDRDKSKFLLYTMAHHYPREISSYKFEYSLIFLSLAYIFKEKTESAYNLLMELEGLYSHDFVKMSNFMINI